MPERDEAGVIWLRVPLDAESAARLQRLATMCRAESTSVAASLLHDILRDDALAHDEVNPSAFFN